jgi:PA14 domain
MRLRSSLPLRAPVNNQAHLRCETLEAREVPSANLMGVNLSGVEDWSYDRFFADVMKSARRPSTFGSHEGTPPIDAKGWPASDASIVLWQGIANMNGSYRLSFTGQADVSTYWGAATVANKQYDPSTNTTTATITYYPTDTTGLLLNLANTRRTSTSAINSGVTNIKLMRPISPGSSVSYDPSVTFTQPIKDLVSKFSVVRMMDNTGSNGWQGINGNWNLRRPADYASQAASGAPYGMAWEYAIQFWNETNTDAWVNIPFPADDAFVTQLATLLKNNLAPGRKIYVEFSNELWNGGGAYAAVPNLNAAIAEVQANPNSPLNYDGVYPTRDSSGWTLAQRRISLRTAQVSNIFRQVFGDDQMMTRVRPVLMSQFGWSQGWLAPELDFMEDYLDNPTYQATPHAPSYYLYGAGGSAYEDADWSKGSNTTVDDVFNSMPNNFAQYVRNDMDWVGAFGLKRIAYEGGPSLDNLTANQNVPASVLQAAWSDPRMRTELVDNHHTWSANGGDLLMYFASTGDYHWGLTNDPFNLNTQKLNAINDLNATPAVPVTYGKLAPLDLTSADFNIPAYQGTISSMQANSLTQEWNGAIFRLDAPGSYSLRLTGTASNGGQVEVFVDGRSLGTVAVPANGDTSLINVGQLTAGAHGIILRARAGSFGIGRVSVLVGDATPTAPGTLTATPLSASTIKLAWVDRSTNETGFLIERASDVNFNTGRTAFGVGPNTTAFTDTSAAPGSTYYYRMCAMNGLVGSIGVGPAAATTPVLPPTTGLSATYFDNLNLTGPTVTRTDTAVDFYWQGVPVSGIGADTFSARWSGQLTAVESGTYRFRTFSDDGVRLWINGKIVVNNWNDHAGTWNTSAGIVLKGGQKYDIRLEYFDNLGGGVILLDWKRPGQTDFMTIPTVQFTPKAGGAILLQDGFDTGLGQWNPVAGKWATSATLASRGSGYVSSGTSPERASLAGDSTWTNYAVSAWVNLANLNGGLSLLGRVADATHYYQLALQRDATGNPVWTLSKRDGDIWTTLATGAIQYSSGWIQLRLTMSGNTLKAESSVDGSSFTQLGTAVDGRYSTGRIGLRSWNAAAYFDDVLVQAV